MTEGLFGESTTANTFMLGVAFQLGTIPISLEAIEEAIELNGASVEANKTAFHWGRQWVLDPAKVRAASVTPEDHLPKPSQGPGEGDRGGRAGRRRAGPAGPAAGRRPGRLPERGLRQGRTSTWWQGGGRHAATPAFAEAVARYAYKLMAYKDEYEVARLLLEEAAKLTVSNQPWATTWRSSGTSTRRCCGPWA